MTVKSATKKKLQDLGIAEQHAHELADDRKWDDVVLLTAVQISAICKTDSQTAEGIHKMVQGGGKGSKSALHLHRQSQSSVRRYIVVLLLLVVFSPMIPNLR